MRKKKMPNKLNFEAEMRYLGVSSSLLKDLDERVYTHKDITGESPDEVRALIVAFASTTPGDMPIYLHVQQQLDTREAYYLKRRSK
jgi:hypothetical protein